MMVGVTDWSAGRTRVLSMPPYRVTAVPQGLPALPAPQVVPHAKAKAKAKAKATRKPTSTSHDQKPAYEQTATLKHSVSNDRSRHYDSNGPRIVKIRAILKIFEPFEILHNFSLRR